MKLIDRIRGALQVKALFVATFSECWHGVEIPAQDVRLLWEKPVMTDVQLYNLLRELADAE